MWNPSVHDGNVSLLIAIVGSLAATSFGAFLVGFAAGAAAGYSRGRKSKRVRLPYRVP